MLDKSTMNSDLLISRNLNIDLKFSSKLLDKLANTMQATTLGDKESMTSQIWLLKSSKAIDWCYPKTAQQLAC